MGNIQTIEPFEVFIGHCKVTLEAGFIQERKEDAIVNSAGSDLNLQRNPSAKALAAGAGEELQQECWRLAPLHIGEVRTTQCYNLKSKSILHCNFGEKYKGKESLNVLKEAIIKCLKVTDRDLKYGSIAFPAIGTGNLNYPADVVADCFIECIKEYFSKRRVSNLREVSIVVFPTNTSTHKGFLKVFEEQAKLLGRGMESKPVTPDKSHLEFETAEFSFDRTSHA